MNCPKCNSQVNDTDKFCQICGNILEQPSTTQVPTIEPVVPTPIEPFQPIAETPVATTPVMETPVMPTVEPTVAPAPVQPDVSGPVVAPVMETPVMPTPEPTVAPAPVQPEVGSPVVAPVMGTPAMPATEPAVAPPVTPVAAMPNAAPMSQPVITEQPQKKNNMIIIILGVVIVALVAVVVFLLLGGKDKDKDSKDEKKDNTSKPTVEQTAKKENKVTLNDITFELFDGYNASVEELANGVNAVVLEEENEYSAGVIFQTVPGKVSQMKEADAKATEELLVEQYTPQGAKNISHKFDEISGKKVLVFTFEQGGLYYEEGFVDSNTPGEMVYFTTAYSDSKKTDRDLYIKMFITVTEDLSSVGNKTEIPTLGILGYLNQ